MTSPITLLPPEFSDAWKRPPEARLATGLEGHIDRFKKFPEALPTAWNAVKRGQSSDHKLARLDDVSQTLGVLGIATLGSLGLSRSGGSLPLWVGAFSWLAAMLITPRVVTTMFKLKTGIDLNTNYVDSSGRMRWFYQDPNFIPLQVYDQKQRNRLYKKLNIPLTEPNRANILVQKLKQLDVQFFTWWMLVAGLGTPVGAALLCDALENPVKDASSNLRVWWAHTRHLNQAMAMANSPEKTKQMGAALETLVETTLGTGTDVTPWARWWHTFPNKVAKALRLNQLPLGSLAHTDTQTQFEAITRHLARQLEDPQVREALETSLTKERGQAEQLIGQLRNTLSHPSISPFVSKDVGLLLEQRVGLANDTAHATLTHLGRLLDIPLVKGAHAWNQAQIAAHMEKSLLSFVEQSAREGSLKQAITGAGSRTLFESVRADILAERYLPAFVKMGDSSKNFLINTVSSLGKRQRWLNGYGLPLAGGILLATAVYVLGWVGNAPPDSEEPPKPKKPPFKGSEVKYG